MFETTADDIALLKDDELREFVSRLCESDLRRRGVSPSYVTWGGDQKAEDGGVDVRVALPHGVEAEGFIPRRDTVYQVKAEDTPASKISSEMKPKGVLRPVIRELADRSGAYIIVSSEGSTSETPLQNRRDAMTKAISELPNADSLKVDFYDRTRLETWLRDHPGTALWVREKIGKPLQGWSGYRAWSFQPEGLGGEYLLDDELRIETQGQKTGAGLSAVNGINAIRETLRRPQGVVRLIGLSGVGKTRLAQALFDARIGEHGLDPGIAAYTNVADGPNPQPVAAVSELIASRRRAIDIVDNCPPDLHQRLSEICRSEESQLSLITIEYDIQEDQTEGTDVFALEVASINLTDKLIRRRFPLISPMDSRRIAEFSGGNARIAIAIAGTIDKSESIAQLRDQELFARLFYQRHHPDETLLRAAQVLSLVYSFNGEDVSDGDNAELSRLGSLMGETADSLFQSTAELERRDLVQKRSIWRAVLPHAIANRLAELALANIPAAKIEATFVQGTSDRLLKSFSRRLGFLHSNEHARSIVTKWLRPGGLLSDIPNLNDYYRSIFRIVAPVAPDETLIALERALLESSDPEVLTSCTRYLGLLRLIAYDPALFERCAALIIRIAMAGDVEKERDEGRRTFASLFPIRFSGTNATIEQRLSVIRPLLISEDHRKQSLGEVALGAALEASHFAFGGEFEFGAHSRDYGHWPRSQHDVELWFRKALALAQEVGSSDLPSASAVRSVVAQKFRGLWAAGVHDDLGCACREISSKKFWPEGWAAVRQTIHYDSNSSAPGISTEIASLEEALRPRDLVQRVRSIVLQEGLIYTGTDSQVDSTTDVATTLEQVETIARDLGRAVAIDPDAFSELLPELVTGNTQQLWSFGAGLAEAAITPRSIWSQLVNQLSETLDSVQRVQVIRGFLSTAKTIEAELVSKLLDESVDSLALGFWYPVLQIEVGLDRNGIDRLLHSLDVGRAPIRAYHS